MRRTSLGMALTIVVGLAIGCGSDGDRGTPERSDAGSDTGSGGVGQDGGVARGGDGGEPFLPLCPNGDADPPSLFPCAQATVFPDPTLDAPVSPPCDIDFPFTDMNPNRVRVFVNCEELPYCREEDQCWQYDSEDAPTAVLFDTALCARLEEGGYTRIDVVVECQY